MTLRIAVTPAGRLLAEADAEVEQKLAVELADGIGQAFALSSADGLFYLASRALAEQLPPSLVFWRDFAARLFHALCGLSDDAWRRAAGAADGTAIAPPDDAQVEEWIAAAPPMRGLEYLTFDVLRRLWHELAELVLGRAAEFEGGPQAFLRSVNPVWQSLGRVTFHLAENKRDPARPFAFLATYAHRVSAGAKLKHLPLADALKQYAGEKNQARLAALLEPVRQAAQSSALVRELLDKRAIFQPQAWSIGQAHRFLSDVPRMEESGLVVRVPDWWNVRQPPRPEVRVRIGQQAADRLDMNSLLDFSAELALDGQPLSEEERQQLLAATEGMILLRGKWVEVDQQKLREALDHWRELEEQYADGIDFLRGMRLLAGAALDSNGDGAQATADWSRVTAGDWLRETLATIRDPNRVTDCQPGRDLRATLRPYQAEGVRWLWFMSRLGLGSCLADDMGLGKTVQVIDLLLQRKRETANTTTAEGGRATRAQCGTAAPGCGPSLLVVPASLVGNWKHELERFAPTLCAFYAHRSECAAETFARVGKNPADELASYDVVVTTYGLASRLEWLREPQWQLVVLDEAQAIKNASSAQTRAVKQLRASGRIVLTGTPVENHLGDLWSIFDFCCPGLLGSASQFKQFIKRLNQRQDSQAFAGLRRLVRPYILRRMKTDPTIVPDLPDKTEMRAECGLVKKQAVLYERAVSELAKRLDSADGMARRGLVLSTLMQLKQICNHPSHYLGESDYRPGDSAKFERLAQICEPIRERQERVLVFTQFQAITAPLAAYLTEVFGRSGLVLHGGVPVGKRKELVRNFQQDEGPPFFVISVKAGGTGLNLTAASHVVHFDRWWNPAVENQATDRAFRIGQKKNVLVHKFVCRGTVEERIDAMLRDKQQLADQVLDEGGETALTELSDDELLKFVSLDLERATMD
ncbi:MAG TPA: DEAD/DEAH box helicase [Pirellulales bacterium]|nr:DEAD/DEAH box helicase [Pirellulales bacterium]